MMLPDILGALAFSTLAWYSVGFFSAFLLLAVCGLEPTYMRAAIFLGFLGPIMAAFTVIALVKWLLDWFIRGPDDDEPPGGAHPAGA